MEALKSLLRLVGDLAFTVLDGIDQMLMSGGHARVSCNDNLFTEKDEGDFSPRVVNPATGLLMVDGIGSVDALGQTYGASDIVGTPESGSTFL